MKQPLISNVRIYGLEESVIASGYPMLSKPLNESEFNQKIDDYKDNLTGEKRAKTLGTVDTGTGHDNYLNGIIVQFDLAFTNKAWTEAERYHFFDFVSSMSTIHKLTVMNLDDSYNEYVDKRIIEIVEEKQQAYIDNPTRENKLALLYNNPSGMILPARMTTNYRQLKTIYHQRKNHTLPEWQEFCKWCLTLPKFKEYVLKEDANV